MEHDATTQSLRWWTHDRVPVRGLSAGEILQSFVPLATGCRGNPGK